MADGNLIWVTILTLGFVILIVASLVNCYIPKVQKDHLKEMRKNKCIWDSNYELVLKHRIDDSWFFIADLAILAASLVSFIMENYMLIYSLINNNARMNVIILMVMFIMVAFIVLFMMAFIPFLVREKMVEDTMQYYLRKYDLVVVDKRYE